MKTKNLESHALLLYLCVLPENLVSETEETKALKPSHTHDDIGKSVVKINAGNASDWLTVFWLAALTFP